MTPAANTLLPWILIALGLINVVLSFIVPDRKKSLISLGLGVFVVVVGFFQLGSQSIQSYRWNARMREIQRERQSDLDELRQRLKDKPGTPAAPAPATKK